MFSFGKGAPIAPLSATEPRRHLVAGRKLLLEGDEVVRSRITVVLEIGRVECLAFGIGAVRVTILVRSPRGLGSSPRADCSAELLAIWIISSL